MRLRPTLLALAVSLATAGATAGAQIAVQPAPAARPGAAKPASATRPASPAKTTGATTAAAPKLEPIDINTATTTELRTVTGIGDVYAAKIIAGRPYHSKDELTRKKILPAGVYAKVKDRFVAHQH